MVPNAMLPYGGAKFCTISRIGEKSSIKFRTTTAELWYVFEHSPHPLSWLRSNSSLALLVFCQKVSNSATVATLIAAFSVSEYPLLEAIKFLKLFCPSSKRLIVSLDKN